MDLAAYGPKEIEDIQFKFASTLYGTSEKPPRYLISVDDIRSVSKIWTSLIWLNLVEVV